MSYRTALSEVLADVVGPVAEETRIQDRFPRGTVTALGQAGLLGLTVSAELGGGGMELREAADVVTRTARVCPSTAAVLLSHYTAVAVLEAYGCPWVRGEIAGGRHLASLALTESESGAAAGGPGVADPLLAPRSVATRSGGVVALRGRKRGVVAAGEADTYVWSSRPLAAPAGLTLWAVPAHASDLFVPARPGVEGPRGTATSTVFADPVLVPAEAMLGTDGAGLDVVLRTVLPWLIELRAAAEPVHPSGAEPVHPSGAEPLPPADAEPIRPTVTGPANTRHRTDSLAAS
ncbi:acyl-CoA dehydrogenase family protein [Streptomyces griseorubiginosus]|uniref:acyl-CoA dehydrogenase family protein n=1 Tax=Streptomyces griseorubiginosus TaxID=67304 RepID=UPI00340DAB43